MSFQNITRTVTEGTTFLSPQDFLIEINPNILVPDDINIVLPSTELILNALIQGGSLQTLSMRFVNKAYTYQQESQSGTWEKAVKSINIFTNTNDLVNGLSSFSIQIAENGYYNKGQLPVVIIELIGLNNYLAITPNPNKNEFEVGLPR